MIGRGLFLVLLLGAIIEPIGINAQGLSQKHNEMLYPTVRVRTEKSGGSGTVIYSKKDANGDWRTFVMTNHHVIEDLIEIKTQWDSLLKKEIKKETTKTAQVEYFVYNNLSHIIGSFAVEADIAAYDVPQDWALLEVRDREKGAGAVATLFPREKIDDEIHILDESFAAGASLGHSPIITQGHITFMDDEIDNYKYWMSSAQTIFGNSGGAVFRYSPQRQHYELIGIPSRISVMAMGYSATPITHMGYFIPVNRIYALLDEHLFRFIYDPKITLEQSEKERSAKQEKAKLSQGDH